MWDEIGWQGVRALMDAAVQVKYKHCQSIRLWKAKCEDEGVRQITKFIAQSKSVNFLELLDASITALGCEFLGQILLPEFEVPIMVMKLDHNLIGAPGMKNLA